MTGEQESDRCYFCGGRLSADITMLPFVVDSQVVIIKNVPAEICSQCGESILDSEVAEEVDRLLKQAQRSGFEVSILAYSQPEFVALATN